MIQGNPQDSTIWDGSRVELSGVAAAKAIRSYQLYVLRSPINDNLGRFQQNDLLLIDQNANELAAIVVILDRQQLPLARRTEGGYQALESGRAMGATACPVGVCVGIVWAPF